MSPVRPKERRCRHCGVDIYWRSGRWFDGFGSSRCSSGLTSHRP